jgi:Spy/CpxP family protein refolding chaperone
MSLLLLVSLAFNVGFGSTLAVHKVRQMCGGQCGTGAGAVLCCEPALLESIELTPEQSETFAAAQDAMMNDLSSLCGELSTERARLGELLTAEHPDQSAINAEIERISAIQQRVQARVVKHLLHQRQQMTLEQRARYDDLIKRRICPCDGAAGGESCPSRGASCKPGAGIDCGIACGNTNSGIANSGDTNSDGRTNP